VKVGKSFQVHKPKVCRTTGVVNHLDPAWLQFA
jgi:hypothetical protein